MEFRSECHRIGERQGAVGNGPEKLSNVNLLGIFSGNDPVKNCKK